MSAAHALDVSVPLSRWSPIDRLSGWRTSMSPSIVTRFAAQRRLLRASKSLQLVWAGTVIDSVLGDHFGETIDVATRNDLLPDSTRLGLEFLDHDESSRYD